MARSLMVGDSHLVATMCAMSTPFLVGDAESGARAEA